MSLSVDDAAMILGEAPEVIREFQSKGWLPDPIPTDYLDPIVNFRIKIQEAHLRRIWNEPWLIDEG